MMKSLCFCCVSILTGLALPASAMSTDLEDVLACLAFEKGLDEIYISGNASYDNTATLENLARWETIVNMARGTTTDTEIDAEIMRVMENNAAMLNAYSHGEDTPDADGYPVGQSIQQYSKFCWETQLKYMPE